jgi:hypothetical protein
LQPSPEMMLRLLLRRCANAGTATTRIANKWRRRLPSQSRSTRRCRAGGKLATTSYTDTGL